MSRGQPLHDVQTSRQYPVGIVAVKYDALIERRMESAPSATWVRLWKMHGSVTWRRIAQHGRFRMVRDEPDLAGEMIYPPFQQYDGSRQQPYAAFADRLSRLLELDNALLLVARFSLGGCAAIVPRLFRERGIASHHIYRLRPKLHGSLTSGYLCHLLNSPQTHDVVSGYANGTTVNMLPIDGVQKPQIGCPPLPLVVAYDSLASHAEQRREEMVLESRTLAAMRDTLLPKLISGELRVKDVERILERAG